MLHTKIIATIGPASATMRTIKELIASGVNVFRLNFSHSSLSEHAQSILYIRMSAQQMKVPISIIADLQGPKIRTGKLKEGGVLLRRGRQVRLTVRPCVGDERCIPVDYPKLPAVVKKNMTILLNEGMITLRVRSKTRYNIHCVVVNGGFLGERKGIHVSGVQLATVFTKKDQKDIVFALKKGVDYIALSFVRTAEDIRRVRLFLEKRGYTSVPLIAKIEKPEAVHNVRKILSEVQGVMVARGDLGVEGKLEQVPIWQKKIIREANKTGKIVITATQMLESMMYAISPTRAEVSDVANAVFDGTGAVMLSGETAVGKYPVRTLKTMRRIVNAAERSDLIPYYMDEFSKSDTSATFSIAHAAINAARDACVKAIIVFTISGFTAHVVSKRRPSIPIFALTPHESAYNRMALFWGVYPLCTTLGKGIDQVIGHGVTIIQRRKLLKKGDRAVVVFGTAKSSGGTDRMRIITIGEK